MGVNLRNATVVMIQDGRPLVPGSEPFTQRQYVWLKCSNCPADHCELARYAVYPSELWCSDCSQLGQFTVVGDPELHRKFLDALPTRAEIEATGIVCTCNRDTILPERHELLCPIYERFLQVFEIVYQLEYPR